MTEVNAGIIFRIVEDYVALLLLNLKLIFALYTT
jgi:hypothetical protein